MNASVIDCSGDNANSTACQRQAQVAYDLALATSLLINVSLFLLIMCAFVLLRPLFPWAYEPLADVRVAGAFAVRRPKPGLLGWLNSLWGVGDREVALKRGLDAVVLLKTTRYLFAVVAAYLLYAFAVLAPVHAAGAVGLSGSAVLSMSNQSGLSLTADVVAVYVASGIANCAFFLLYRSYFAMRTRYRVTSLRPENYTVLVREFDPTLTPADLWDIFERIFPGKVHAVEKAVRTPTLWKMLEEREDVGRRLERAAAYYERKRERQQIRVCPVFFCCFGRRADAMTHFGQRYDELSRLIAIEQEHISDVNPQVGAAFVTFVDRVTAQTAAQAVIKHELLFHPLDKRWTCDLAPPPETVLWRRGLATPHVVRWLLSLVVNAATFVLIFFWLVPIGFAQSISNLTVLSQIFPFLIPLVNALPPAAKSFIEGFLPSVVVIVFLALLVKWIITPLCRLEGQWSMAVVRRAVFNKFYLFQVFNVFLGSIVAGGILKVLPEIVQNPLSTVNLLAKALPAQAGYFTNLVMTMSFTTFALAMLRPGPLITGLILPRLFPGSRRDFRATRGPYFFDYPVVYAQMLLVFLLCTTFSTLSPLVLPFGLIYFALLWMSSKYLLLYCCTPQHPSNGEIFPAIFTRLCWSMLTFQVVLFGVLGGRNYIGAVAIVPLIVAQVLFWLWTDKQFHAGSKYGALDADAAGVYSREESHMKRQVEERLLEPLLLEDSTGEESDSVDVQHVLPARDTYKFPTLRPPLFVAEDQSPSVAERSVDPLFFASEWIPASSKVGQPIPTEETRRRRWVSAQRSDIF